MPRTFNETQSNIESDGQEEAPQGFEPFDYDEVSRRLDELGESPAQRHYDDDRLKLALGVLLRWPLKVDLKNKNALRRIGLRMVAMAWVVEPELFGDERSLRSLAKKLGFSAPNIAPLTAEFSRLHSLWNEHQKHDWRKTK